ncbi:hypothetical protein [Halosimplex pelagicum]|uniref:Uncharacterized protein n=1 Tax=Halosimplex pelagicum TaxID=869886 RepID=A0A7D5PBL2_9EURY|nr:hypothetical protein [Halosimplex pelagicum]QLH83824.1 hypothetical protein HZS54_20280 [Halosimplex pelagicum]
MHETDEHWLPEGSIVNLFQQDSVVYGYAPPQEFNRLDDAQRQQISSALADEFSIETISTVWGDLKEWKAGDVQAMGREESLFAQIVGENSPHDDPSGLKSRLEQAVDTDWGDDACRCAWMLYGLSQSVSLAIVSEECEVTDKQFRLYRGLSDRYDIPHVLAAAIDNSSQRSFSVPATVLNNYSPSEANAAGYSPIVVEKQVDVTDIILTPDYIVEHADDTGLLTDDGECRVLGTVTADFSAEEAAVLLKPPNQKEGTIQHRYSIEEFFDPLPRPDERGFSTFIGLLQEAHERIQGYSQDEPFSREKLLVTTAEGVERVSDWYAEVADNIPEKSPTVEESLKLLTDGEVRLS